MQRFVDATERAQRAGFDVVELHFDHRHLVAGWGTPNANPRSDAWGGSLANRLRLASAIATRKRAAGPAQQPRFCRIPAADGCKLDDSVPLALKACGVDLIDCSSGKLTEAMRAVPVPRGLGFQAPFPARRGLTRCWRRARPTWWRWAVNRGLTRTGRTMLLPRSAPNPASPAGHCATARGWPSVYRGWRRRC